MRVFRYVAIGVVALGLSSCLFAVKFPVGGYVSGLEGTGLVLQLNGADSLTFSSDGSFTFSSDVAKDVAYTVTVATQPTNPTQTCTVHNGTGTITTAAVTNVVVNCTQAVRFAYVANQTDNTLSAYAVDTNTGALVPLTGSPFAVNGTAPRAITIDPNREHLYVVNNGSNSVSILTLDYASGLPTLANLAIATGNAPTAVAIDPTNRFMYVTNETDDTVSAYTLNGTTATAITGSPFAVGREPFAVTTDPAGNYLYVANYEDGTVSAFAIDSATGELTALSGSPFAAGAGAVAVGIDPTGAYAYVANETAATISLYSVGSTTGTLTAVAGSPLATATHPEALAFNPLGGVLYAANVPADNTIANYEIAPIDGALTQGTTAATGTFPVAIQVDPAGRFVYVANETSNNVSAYTIDSATGALTAVSGSPFAAGAGARAIALD